MKDNLSIKNLKRRAKEPVNTFWKKVQLIGGAVALLAGSILAAPIVLPVAVSTGIAIAGAVATTAVSVATFTTKDKKEATDDGDAK